VKVTLVRHGAVEERYLGCYNGHIDISLSHEGRLQSQALGKRLADEPFDAIFCSDLLRAKETLQAMWQSSFDAIEPIYTSTLREKSWGRHEGMNFTSIISQEGLEYHSFETWIEALDGEPLERFEQRVKNFFFYELQNYEKKSVLIVTHAGVMHILRSLVEKISYEEAFSHNVAYSSYVKYCFSEENGYQLD
jgi:broad specificity phosphatase PhoE